MPVDAGPAPEIFRLAVEASPSGMIAVNGDGAIIMINGEIERLFGYAREELLGQPVDILLPDGVRAKHASLRNAIGRHVCVRSSFNQHRNERGCVGTDAPKRR